MTKVYLVMGNWCDDTWVRAVCFSRGIAEAIANTKEAGDTSSTGYWVDEWDITDPIANPMPTQMPHRTTVSPAAQHHENVTCAAPHNGAYYVRSNREGKQLACVAQ